MKYTVGEYNLGYNAHRCTAEDGRKFYIDLMVNADLAVDDKNYDKFVESLTGKTVEIEILQHYVAIGHGVKVLS